MAEREAGSTSPALLRRMNAERVLDALRELGPADVSTLARAAGVSRVTLDAVVESLLALGLVAEVPAPEASGNRRRGRPRRRLRFRAEAGAVAGIDIGALRATVVVTDLAGTVLAAREEALTQDMSRRRRLNAVRRLAAAALGSAGVEARAIRAVGIGTPGIVDRGSGTVTHCVSMPEWSGLDLAASFTDLFPHPTVENDANLAALGERWRGIAHEYDDVVCLLAGDRIGAGIVMGGELLRGNRGGTGEMAFIGLLVGEPASDAGDLLRRAVGETVGAYLSSIDSSGRSDHSGDSDPSAARTLLLDLVALHRVPVADVEATVAGIRSRRTRARRDLETALTRVCRAVLVLATLINPELFVIGGRAAGAAELVLPPVRAALDQLSAGAVPAVAASTLGERAVAMGAVRAALDVARPTLLAPIG